MRALCDNPGNMSDRVLRALVAKGGMVGIHSSADLISQRYYEYSKTHATVPVNGMTRQEILYAELGLERSRNQDFGEYIDGIDAELGGRWRRLYAEKWHESAEAMALVPTVDEYVDHVAHVAQIAGPGSVALGMDFTNARSTLKGSDGRALDGSGYGQVVEGLKRRGLATPGILGENWLRLLGAVESEAKTLRTR
jgi:microsomal dipeptidase-like Zn-dependent dipeptidase